jgi:acetate---CoA ligase (ADP-forming)
VTATPLAPKTQTEHEPTDPRQAAAVRAMLEARSIALVGASARPDSLGAHMIREVARSSSRPRTYLVNPRYAEIGGAPCLPSLADLPEPVDLAILAVPDTALEEQLAAAARVNARSAIIFGSAFDPPGTSGLRDRLAATAKDAGMALCGAGCMGFVNLARGLLAVGYLLPDPVPAGPVALITHSGSVFTAMLNARRGFGFTLAASPGQELVTGAPAFARYALSLPETRVLALVLEAIRDATELRAVLGDALTADVPVVLLSAGGSPAGKALVAAHSGALAAADGAWEALAGAYGVHRVGDLAELADTLELFSSGRRCAPGGGIATVHDSGLERAHVADLAAEFGVPFAPIGPQTTARLAAALDPGLEPANPLDLWGTGRDPEPVATQCLAALAADPAVTAVALAVDLAPEWDGDEAYPRAVIATASGTAKPVAVLAGLPATLDPIAAAALRKAGVPVLEGTRSGLLALRHLLDHADRPAPPPNPEPTDPERRQRWARLLCETTPDSATLFGMLREYGIPAVRASSAETMGQALDAAAEIGYPVVLKTDEPGIAHKSDLGGVRLRLGDPQAVADAYDDLSDRLGPRVLVCETAAPGTEIALGLTRDPALGPLLVIGAGGLLIEILAERAVVLPPVTSAQARVVISRLRLARILAGARGQPAADLDSIAAAITGLSALACDLGDVLDALDINPLICGPNGAVAADVLAVPRLGRRHRYDHRHGSRTRAVSGTGGDVRRGHRPGGRLRQFVVVEQQ